MIRFRSKRLNSDIVNDKLHNLRGQSLTRVHIRFPAGTDNVEKIVKDISKNVTERVTYEESSKHKQFNTTVHHTPVFDRRRRGKG